MADAYRSNIYLRKRQRAPNFNEVEKKLLVQLYEKHKKILENKRNITTILRQKNATWRLLLDEFSSYGVGPERDVKQLKYFFENYKKMKKREGIFESTQFQLNAPNTSMQNDVPLVVTSHDDISVAVAEIISLGTSNPELEPEVKVEEEAESANTFIPDDIQSTTESPNHCTTCLRSFANDSTFELILKEMQEANRIAREQDQKLVSLLEDDMSLRRKEMLLFKEEVDSRKRFFKMMEKYCH